MKEINVAVLTGIEEIEPSYYNKSVFSIIMGAKPDVKSVIFPGFMANVRKGDIGFTLLLDRVDFVLTNTELLPSGLYLSHDSRIQDLFNKLSPKSYISFATVIVDRVESDDIG